MSNGAHVDADLGAASLIESLERSMKQGAALTSYLGVITTDWPNFETRSFQCSSCLRKSFCFSFF